MLDLHVPATRVTDLGAAVHALLEGLAPIAIENGVTLRQASLIAACVRVDADSCMHVLLNVMENAIKSAGASGVVEICTSRQDGTICVHVDDNASGVANGDRERIFSYGQGARVPEGSRGKGVGLSIVRAIVERAGGRVEVGDSHLGGARFTIALPSLESEL